MNPIISNFSDGSIDDFPQKTLPLNELYKIDGLVSYIYYPSQRGFPFLGHAELEIKARSYTLFRQFKIRYLYRMIKLSESGHGFPFFRFYISVTPKQLRDLKKNSLLTRGLTCSMGVAEALSRQGEYTIPLPIAIFPFTSAIYLAGAKMLGSQRISQVDFHGSKNITKNFLKSIMGIAGECLNIYVLLSLGYLFFSKIKSEI